MLVTFRKGVYALSEGTSGAQGAFREGGFAPFSYMKCLIPIELAHLTCRHLTTPEHKGHISFVHEFVAIIAQQN